MKKTLLVLVLVLTNFMIVKAQVDIATARTYAQGQTVTISGIVTNGGTLGPIRYIQDATGGLPVYDPTVTNNWNQGDSVTVSGEMGSYNGLIQIVNTTSNTVHTTGNTLPTPNVVTPNGINASTESTLLQVNNVTFANGGAAFGVGTYSFSNDAGESSVIYVRSGHPLVGTTIPLAKVNMVGIASIFSGTYQMLPRDANDITIAANFFFTSPPEQFNLTQSGFDLTWQTNINSSSNVRYGTTEAMTNHLGAGGSTTNHTVTLTNLTAGEIYYAQPYSISGTDTIFAPMAPYATVSNSTGQVDVYFNLAVDVTVATGTHATHLTGAQLEAKIIEYIDNAQNTIDIAIYNINRSTFITALNNAHTRGVQVRFITNSGSANVALQNVPPLFPKISGNGSALMHDKFIVVDADSQNDSWVFMGSMNFTTNGIVEDANNVIFIQDQSLAKAYRMEFEEMWGGSGASPGIFNVKFGAAKSNNTPHKFIVGGIPMESYFSPSDATTSKISEALQSANSKIEFAMFSFTRNELRDDILAAYNSGAMVRGMIENINDTGGEYNTLLAAGVNVKAHPESDQLHHKYAIVDEDNVNSDPIVITGSHNWSSAAESSNDENTLIIHDATIANMYAQEFNARWLGWLVNTPVVPTLEGLTYSIYPNPAQSYFNLEIDNQKFENVTLSIFDMNGRLVKTEVLNNISGKTIRQISVNQLPAGSYGVILNIGGVAIGEVIKVVR